MASIDISNYENSLLLSQPLREPITRAIIESMQLPSSSFGLDIGCGIGFTTFMLAEALGPLGRVTGADTEEEFLNKASSLLHRSEYREQISFKKGQADNLPFSDCTFDWACSTDCVGAIPVEPVMLLKEISRVVKPGGKVFISIWSSQKLLPGYPLVEARLNTSPAGIAPFRAGMEPGRHIMRGREWFQQAGFKHIKAQTFVSDICAPLTPEIRNALIDLFDMRWGSIDRETSPDLWQDFQRLCSTASPEFILSLPGYYAFFTYTVFSGIV